MQIGPAEILFLLLCVGLGVLLVVVGSMLRRAWLRRKFTASHAPLDDEAFLDAAGARPSERGILLAMRKALSECAGVPPERIHPDDRLFASDEALFLGQTDLRALSVRLSRTSGLPLEPDDLYAALVAGETVTPSELEALRSLTVAGFARRLAQRLDRAAT